MNLKQTVIALGFFDGVHRGHGALLKKTVERAQALGAEPVVFTFDRPPKEVVTGKPVFLINSPEDRRELVKRIYGIDRVVMAPFDREMMTLPWDAFIEEKLVKELGAAHLVAGHDYHFGYKNQGDPQLLQEKCRELGLGCDIIPKVEVEGITVSSTYIRTLVEAGDVERAAVFLGHRHCMTRTVGHGQRIGRTIGIPTVNLTVPSHVLVPQHGVYVSRVYLPDGRSFAGVTNVGTRPTVCENGSISVETFLLDFDGDLYGTDIRLEFCRRLRGEVKFASLEALRDGIRKNIEETREYFRKQLHRVSIAAPDVKFFRCGCFFIVFPTDFLPMRRPTMGRKEGDRMKKGRAFALPPRARKAAAWLKWPLLGLFAVRRTGGGAIRALSLWRRDGA